MNDIDADEPVAPPKRAARRKGLSTDRTLTGIGLLLAGAAAFFPWYVFFNQEKFGIHVASGERSRDLPDWPARNVFSVSPLAMVNKNDPQPKAVVPDPITTATATRYRSRGYQGTTGGRSAIPG